MNDPIGKLDPNGMWVETAGGWSTDNKAEISAYLKDLKAGQQEGEADKLKPDPSPEAKKKSDAAARAYMKDQLLPLNKFLLNAAMLRMAIEDLSTVSWTSISKFFTFGKASSDIGAEGAVWSQKTFGYMFSSTGKFAGKTIDEIAGSLKKGELAISEVPIDVVVRNGQTYILNTRSSVALTKAGIPRSSWEVVNRTGVASFENMLSGQLSRNGLTTGTTTIRQTGSNVVIKR